MKPRFLKETALAMCLMNVAGFAFIEPSAGPVAVQAAIFGAIIGLTYIVLWFYWIGKNWARILVMLGAILSLINVAFIESVNEFAASLIIIEALFGAFMLWWLNTKEVKTYFVGERG